VHAYLTDQLPFPARITIAENGSTDATWMRARELEDEFSLVRAVQIGQPGRGGALRSAWSASDADVLAYMDVDLSTDLNALLPLIAPLVSGHSDVAIGTRLAWGARVVRGPRREIISRCYNLLLYATLGTRFSDAQCGFKAIRAEAARALMPLTADRGWFFDTELLVLAQRAGLRIHEVPVDWIDDCDSRVKVIATALAAKSAQVTEVTVLVAAAWWPRWPDSGSTGGWVFHGWGDRPPPRPVRRQPRYRSRRLPQFSPLPDRTVIHDERPFHPVLAAWAGRAPSCGSWPAYPAAARTPGRPGLGPAGAAGAAAGHSRALHRRPEPQRLG
jgi:hypothetical protein